MKGPTVITPGYPGMKIEIRWMHNSIKTTSTALKMSDTSKYLFVDSIPRNQLLQVTRENPRLSAPRL